jgi:NarL family two-component system response regulator LiaR
VLIKAATESLEEDGLTRRELEILQLRVTGSSNPDIAEKLFVSRSTIKFHVSNILMKLGAATRTEAVAIALQRKLV